LKTLLFNGCSFVAGDEIVWDSYCIDSGRPGLKWKNFAKTPSKTKEDAEFWENYRFSYRRQRNLPAMVAQSLGKRHVDISLDGNSNDMIAFATVNYFLSLQPEERKNYHVCIGWTTTSRIMKFSKYVNGYFNLHVNHIGIEKDHPILSELKDYLNIAIGQSYDEDFFLNFVKNVMLLENFLIANDITYTFFKSLGTSNDTAPRPPAALIPPHVPDLAYKNITNNHNWMMFDNDHLPHMGGSWTSAILHHNRSLFVSDTNLHPNLKAAKSLSAMLKNKIISQNVGFS
jgi:hypothetical protein